MKPYWWLSRPMAILPASISGLIIWWAWRRDPRIGKSFLVMTIVISILTLIVTWAVSRRHR